MRAGRRVTVEPALARECALSGVSLDARNYLDEHPVRVVGVWDGGAPDGDAPFDVRVTSLGVPGDGCADVFAHAELENAYALRNLDIDGGGTGAGSAAACDASSAALGNFSLALAPGSHAAAAAGGRLELVATLSRAPALGRVALAVALSDPALATVRAREGGSPARGGGTLSAHLPQRVTRPKRSSPPVIKKVCGLSPCHYAPY